MKSAPGNFLNKLSDYAALTRPAALRFPKKSEEVSGRATVGEVSSQGVTRRGADRRSPRFTLLVLAAVFVLPFAAGSALFWSGWRPAALRNHGDLIQPPRALPPSAAPHGKWLLIVPAPLGCAQACLVALRQLQQVHVALGKDQGRVQRILVSGDSPFIDLRFQGGGRADDGINATASGLAVASLSRHSGPPLEGDEDRQMRFRGLTIISPDSDEAAWRQALDDFAPAVFVADPLGNVMMRYGEPIDARKVLRDMERLLKYSWVR